MFYLTNVEEYSGKIYIMGYNEDGKKKIIKRPYYQELYTKTKQKTKWKNIWGDYLKRQVFKSPKEYKQYIAKRKEMDLPYYGEVDSTLHFIYKYFKKYDAHNDIFKKLELKNKILKKMRIFYYDIESAYGDAYVKFKDLEKSTAKINALSFFDTKTKTLCTLGLNEFTRASEKRMLESFKDDVERIKYIRCGTEKELLEKWCSFIKKAEIDILVGYNSDGFDNPYVVWRMKENDININKISPLGKTTYRSKEIRDKKDRLKKIEYNTRIYGLITVDYWKLYKTLTYKNYSSNSLDSVAKREIGEGKIDYISESTKTDNTIFDLNSLADNDWETFIKYNMKDVIIMKMLDDKIGFMDNSWLLAMIANCEYFKIFSTIRFWDSSIYSSLRNENIIIDADRKQTARKYIGGYCKNSETEGLIPNIYKWHVSYDVDSEYPTASIGANISPETRLVWTNDNKEKYRELYEYWLDMIEKYELPIKEITGEKYNNTNEKKVLVFMVYPNKDYKKFVKLLHKYNLTYTPNGKFFKRDKQGFLPKIFQHDFDFRLHLKKLLKETDDEAYYMQLKRLEQNIKIRLNSGYGYTGNKYSRYCDVDNIAESIVTFGRIEIQTISYYISKYIYKKWGKFYDKENIKFENISTYNDTDSTYLNINPIVQDIISKNKTDWENMDLHDFTRKYILPITDVELQNVINKILKRIYTCCNGYVDYFGMKREVVADKCVFVGAKHYAMRKLFDGGKQISKEKELKVNGLEIIKSTTPGILRDRMMKFVSLILDEDFKSLRKEMREVKNDLLNKFNIDDIAKNTSISVSIDEYTDDYGNPKKGTPQHIKASINYNNYVDRKNISLPEINTDDKIKLIYLKTPNPVGTDVNCIAYKNEFPNHKKFKELEKYIDRNKMFDVLVNSNVDNIVEKIGMKIDLNKTALF